MADVAATANAAASTAATVMIQKSKPTRDRTVPSVCAMLGLEHVVLFQRQPDEAVAGAGRHAKDSPFSYAVDVPKLTETVKRLLAE